MRESEPKGRQTGRARAGRFAAQLAAITFVFAAAISFAGAADARTLDRRGLVPTFQDEFNTLHVADPRDVKTWVAPNWKTWYRNGPDPYNLHNRTLPGNKEAQAYVDAAWPPREDGLVLPEAVSVRDGLLRLRADRAPDALKDKIHGLSYTSGMVSSWGMFDQRYGVFEARMRLPRGRGFWPAFWTLDSTGDLPNELDIMEFLGHDVHTTYAVTHWRARGRHTSSGRGVPHAIDITKDFHVFTVDWRPTTLTYYIDDVEVFQMPTPPDMHNRMYMILNLAVGGKWPGYPDETTPFPAQVEVDWVRVWRRPGHETRPPRSTKRKS